MSKTNHHLNLIPLGELCQYDNGGTPSKSERSYWDGEIPWITSSEIADGTVLPARSHITPEGIKNSATKQVPAGTLLLVTRTGVGKVAICSYSLAFSQDITAIYPDESRLDKRYLRRFLDTQGAYFARFSRGATIKGITRDVLNRLEIPLPPLPEQQRIAAILDKADTLRRKRREARDNSDALIAASFRERFGDPVANSRALDTIPLSEYGIVITGNTPSRKDHTNYGNVIEWIKSDNINTPSHWLTKSTEGLSEKGRTLARTVPAGSTLVTCIAGSPACVGNAAMTDRTVAFNQQINAITPNPTVDPYFLYSLILLSQPLVQRASTASMKGMVSKSNFEQLRVIKVKEQEQKAFSRVFQHILQLVNRNDQASASSDNMFSSLVQRAFKGEL